MTAYMAKAATFAGLQRKNIAVTTPLRPTFFRGPEGVVFSAHTCYMYAHNHSLLLLAQVCQEQGRVDPQQLTAGSGFALQMHRYTARRTWACILCLIRNSY